MCGGGQLAVGVSMENTCANARPRAHTQICAVSFPKAKVGAKMRLVRAGILNVNST